MQVHKSTQVRQKEIVAAVREIIVKSGSEHVTIKSIAKAIGTSEGAIYRHFSSKSEILSFLVDDIEESLIGDLKKRTSTPIDSLETLAGLVLQHITLIEQRKGVTFQVIAEIISYGDTNLNLKIYDVIDKYSRTIETLLVEAVSNGLVNPEVDLKAASKIFFGMTQGVVNTWALGKYQTNLESDFKTIWSVFIKALR